MKVVDLIKIYEYNKDLGCRLSHSEAKGVDSGEPHA